MIAEIGHTVPSSSKNFKSQKLAWSLFFAITAGIVATPIYLGDSQQKEKFPGAMADAKKLAGNGFVSPDAGCYVQTGRSLSYDFTDSPLVSKAVGNLFLGHRPEDQETKTHLVDFPEYAAVAPAVCDGLKEAEFEHGVAFRNDADLKAHFAATLGPVVQAIEGKAKTAQKGSYFSLAYKPR